MSHQKQPSMLASGIAKMDGHHKSSIENQNKNYQSYCSIIDQKIDFPSSNKHYNMVQKPMVKRVHIPSQMNAGGHK